MKNIFVFSPTLLSDATSRLQIAVFCPFNQYFSICFSAKFFFFSFNLVTVLLIQQDIMDKQVNCLFD